MSLALFTEFRNEPINITKFLLVCRTINGFFKFSILPLLCPAKTKGFCWVTPPSMARLKQYYGYYGGFGEFWGITDFELHRINAAPPPFAGFYTVLWKKQ